MAPRMHTEDWEKFERFGIMTSGQFTPITESSNVIMGKYKTERRDKRAIRVAAYAPLGGAAIGAAMGHTAAGKFRDETKAVRERNLGKAEATKNQGWYAKRKAKKAKVAAREASRTGLPRDAPRTGAVKPRTPPPTNPSILDKSKKQIIPSGGGSDFIDKAKKHGKDLMGRVDAAGTKYYGSQRAYNIMKKHTKAGLIAGAAFVPLHSLHRLHIKNKARKEEVGKRENF